MIVFRDKIIIKGRLSKRGRHIYFEELDGFKEKVTISHGLYFEEFVVKEKLELVKDDEVVLTMESKDIENYEEIVNSLTIKCLERVVNKF